jgi:hypothetical protein
MRRRNSQGEALAVWAVWGATAVAVVVTYSHVDPAELYHVSGSGVGAGLGRALVHLNWPIALVAIALTLTAMGALPRRAWWAAAASIALCATMPWFVDQGDLDARWVNVLPAAGVALALGLTAAAARRAGTSFEPRLPGDPLRLVIAAVVVVLSLPWLAAELGFQLPGDVFMGEEPMRTTGGGLEAAVHLGEHHGFHGALLLLSALALSRARVTGRRLRGWQLAWTAVLAGYGAINFAQDLWHEQLVKRGWVEWRIPSALYPDLEPVTLATLALVGLAAWLLAREGAILRP